VLTLTLPWPPSTNSYWRHPTKGRLAGRHLISEQGRAYREAVARHVLMQDGRQQLDCPLAIDIEVFMPDKRRRDLDNLLKSLLDSMTHAGVWADDSQIHDLRIRRGSTLGGFVHVHIAPMES
jgi:crossover junction endodeoxyribonuclease RusA